MLDEGHLEQLKLDTQIEPQHFEQYEAEAVFIPAGCPHQVRQGFRLGGVSTWRTPNSGICWQSSTLPAGSASIQRGILMAESATAPTVCS